MDPDSIVAAMVRKFGDERCGLLMTAADIDRLSRAGMGGVPCRWRAEAEIRRMIPLKHQGLLYTVARRYRNRGTDVEDLVGAGQLGLIRAAKLYDPAVRAGDPPAPMRFSAYAMRWINSFALAERWKNEGPIRVPRHVRIHLWAVRHRGTAGMGVRMRRNVADAVTVLSMRACSGDSGIPGGAPFPDIPCREDRETGDLAADCEALLRVLTPRERVLVEAKFELGGRADVPRETLAAEFGISKFFVSQIRRGAMDKMRDEAARRGMTPWVA